MMGGHANGVFFYFVPWGGTSTHTILGPETECTKLIQGLNNYQLLIYLVYVSEDRLEPTTDGGRLDEKRLRRDKRSSSMIRPMNHLSKMCL